eukprot:tig00021428_g21164.t1
MFSSRRNSTASKEPPSPRPTQTPRKSTEDTPRASEANESSEEEASSSHRPGILSKLWKLARPKSNKKKGTQRAEGAHPEMNAGAGPSTSARQIEQPKKVPTVFTWTEYVTSRNVLLTGSFVGWNEFIPMIWEDNEFYTVCNLLPGPYMYKFVVDNQWRYAKDQEIRTDERGIMNNYIEVKPLPPDDPTPVWEPESLEIETDGWTQTPPAPPHSSSPTDARMGGAIFKGRGADSPPPLPAYLRDEIAPMNSLQTGYRAEPPPPPLNVQLARFFQGRMARLPGEDPSVAPPHVLSLSHRYRSKYSTQVFVTPARRPAPLGPAAV